MMMSQHRFCVYTIEKPPRCYRVGGVSVCVGGGGVHWHCTHKHWHWLAHLLAKPQREKTSDILAKQTLDWEQSRKAAAVAVFIFYTPPP